MGILVFLAILILSLYFLYRVKEVVCRDCGFVGKLSKTASGNILIEIILWCCFIIPGLIYTIWSSTSRRYRCPSCSGRTLIPTDSPVGKKLLSNSNQSSTFSEHKTESSVSNNYSEVEKRSFDKKD